MNDEDRARRVEALRQGHTQWGHGGSHWGVGTEECPRSRHHHHDLFCQYPTQLELQAAGVEAPEGGWRSRG